MTSDFDPNSLLKVLDAHHVEFVLIGGYAARLHGASHPTVDLDITPDPTADNLERLATALRELDARIRVEGIEDGLPFAFDSTSLRSIQILNLTTRHGDLDIALEPSGTGGFTDLVGHADRRRVAGVEILVASLPDIIRSKEAASRPKDLAALTELDQLAARGNDPTEHIAPQLRAETEE